MRYLIAGESEVLQMPEAQEIVRALISEHLFQQGGPPPRYNYTVSLGKPEVPRDPSMKPFFPFNPEFPSDGIPPFLPDGSPEPALMIWGQVTYGNFLRCRLGIYDNQHPVYEGGCEGFWRS